MVDVRFELTTNDPWSCRRHPTPFNSLLGYWQKVNQSSTQTKPYNKALWSHNHDIEILRTYGVHCNAVSRGCIDKREEPVSYTHLTLPTKA